MAVIKCKMCGGDLNIEEGMSVAECEYCGTKQTVPNVDDEKKLKLFERANRLRAACEFDKAAGVYESILADFDTEAEAYWGLILCRYGIEYVDDPAAGRKIPTCHRSSFESVLDDPNFELVMENSDAVSRQVYRSEAKAIEELRKRIIEVSSKEEPYDVFISYKELDGDGERTVDSVIAQDIYKELTNEGYRVFFSRISLESKLGVEYEPYIFAALNSAKVMLVVGTSYDNFNAVWVKNEWSRYLALMSKERGRALIPCFKGIDAYDMPKEFNKLAAQDMGKVGAMQDLVRGVEKLLGKKQQEQPAAVAAAPVMRSESDAKTTASVKRGYMALEDGEWKDAEAYFNQALTLDAECAEAYWGLYLIGRKIKSTVVFSGKTRDSFDYAWNDEGDKVEACPEDTVRIQAAAAKYTVTNYLAADTITKLYNFKRWYWNYENDMDDYYRSMFEEGANRDKNYNRAMKFARGAFREELNAALQPAQELYVHKKAELPQLVAVQEAEIKATYAKHLDDADRQAKALYDEACAQRKADYAKAQQLYAQGDYAEAQELFTRLTDYADSADKVQLCVKTQEEQERAQEEQARQTAYSEAMAAQSKAVTSAEFDGAAELFDALDSYRDSKARADACRQQATLIEKAKKKKTITIGSIVTAVVIAISVFCIAILPNMQRYADAQKLEADGNKGAAAIAYYNLGNYRDARERSFALWDEIAEKKTLIAFVNYTVGVKEDGTVVVAGSDHDGKYDWSDWTDIVAVSGSAGLKADGTVVTASSSDPDPDWTDIVALADGGYLKADGTIVGSRVSDYKVRDMYGGEHVYTYDRSSWTDIVAVDDSAGLRADGTVVATGGDEFGECNVSDWTDIVAISTDLDHTVGLRADGTVVVAGDNWYGQSDVSGWMDIVAIEANSDSVFGLKANGTVVAAGNNDNGQCDVSDWTDIVAIEANSDSVFGLKANGTVVAAGNNDNGQCDVSDWTDIVVIEPGYDYIVGLRADGTVVAAGKNDNGQCDVSGWTNIRLPKGARKA